MDGSNFGYWVLLIRKMLVEGSVTRMGDTLSPSVLSFSAIVLTDLFSKVSFTSGDLCSSFYVVALETLIEVCLEIVNCYCSKF